MQYTGNTIKLGTKLTNSSGCLDSAHEPLNHELFIKIKRECSNKTKLKIFGRDKS